MNILHASERAAVSTADSGRSNVECEMGAGERYRGTTTSRYRSGSVADCLSVSSHFETVSWGVALLPYLYSVVATFAVMCCCS